MHHRDEPVLVDALVAELAVEAFDMVRYAYLQGGIPLDNMAFSFHGGANNMAVTQRIFARAGVRLFGGINDSGFRNNPIDLVPQLIGGNARSATNIFGSMQNFPKLFGDETVSPHTLPYIPPEP